MSILSVIVVNWNRRRQAAECLDSVLRSDTEKDVELVVVDNGSSDGSEAELRSQFPDIKVVQAGWNSGFAEGVNIGISHASGEWIALVNNDATVAPDWVPAILAAIKEADGDVGMLQCHMTFNGGGVVNSTGLQIYTDGTGGDRGFGDPAGSREYAAELFCPTGGAAAYRREMLDQVRLGFGVLDRRFFMYAEDADLGWRCRLHGWHARYVPDAVVEHAFQGSANSHGSTFVALHCRRNRMMTMAKNASPGLIVKGLRVTAEDLLWIAVRCGLKELARTVWAVTRSAGDRRTISRRSVVSRRQLEATWFSAPPQGHRRTVVAYTIERVTSALRKKTA